MKKIALAFLALASAANLFAQTADPNAPVQPKPEAQAPQPRTKHFLWDRLNLTDDQKDKLKQICEADRDTLRSAWAQVKIAQESLHAALLANPDNTADIQAKATDLANALGTKSIQSALHEAKIDQVLTPPQRVTFEEAKQHRMDRWRWHHGGPEHRRWQQEQPWQRRNQPSPPATAAPTEGQTPETSTN
jgi:Spy/CpxP family protein refolding chaperone